MTTETKYDEAAEMRDFAETVARDLENEGGFSARDIVGEHEDYETPYARLVPGDIWDYVDERELNSVEDPDHIEDLLQTAYDHWSDDRLASVLDISGTVSFHDGMTLETLTVVLGTGGPHVEVTFNEGGHGHVRAYGWFMAHLTDVRVNMNGHPIAGLFELYAATVEGRL